jgi:hypothetical protein
MAENTLTRLMWRTLLLAVGGYLVWSVGLIWFLVVGAVSLLMVMLIVHFEPPLESSPERINRRTENRGTTPPRCDSQRCLTAPRDRNYDRPSVRASLERRRKPVTMRAQRIQRPLLDLVVEHIGNTRLSVEQRDLALCVARNSKFCYDSAVCFYSRQDVRAIENTGLILPDRGYLVPANKEMAKAIKAAFGAGRPTSACS